MSGTPLSVPVTLPSTASILPISKGVIKPREPIAKGTRGGTAPAANSPQVHRTVPSPPKVITKSTAWPTEQGTAGGQLPEAAGQVSSWRSRSTSPAATDETPPPPPPIATTAPAPDPPAAAAPPAPAPPAAAAADVARAGAAAGWSSLRLCKLLRGVPAALPTLLLPLIAPPPPPPPPPPPLLPFPLPAGAASRRYCCTAAASSARTPGSAYTDSPRCTSQATARTVLAKTAGTGL